MRNYKAELISYHKAKYGETPQVKTRAQLTSNFMIDSIIDYINDLQKQKSRCQSKQELAVIEGRITDAQLRFNLVI